MVNRTNSMESDIPFIVIKNEIVIDVSKGFCDLIGFQAFELKDKLLMHFLNIIRANFDINITDTFAENQGYIFSRGLDAINVKLTTAQDTCDNTIIYFTEVPNLRLKDIFLYAYKMCEDNLSGMAIYSAPDLVLLKANEKYIKYWNEPLNDIDYCIGKSLKKIKPDWESSQQSIVWNRVMDSGKTLQLKEFKHNDCTRSKYWDLTITPIFMDKEIRYIVVNNIDVTDMVETRKNIEKQSKLISEQNKLLEAIVDNISDDLIIIDAEGNHIKTNKSAVNRTKDFELRNAEDVYANFTFTDLEGNSIPLEDMPVSYVLRGQKYLIKKWL